MILILLELLIGGVIGLSLGLLGGGGSILTVPALVYLLGQDAHAAIGISLVIVGINAFVGALMHQHAGNVRLTSALLFGSAGLLAAFVGARLSQLLPASLLLVLFALLMIAVATLMLRLRSIDTAESVRTPTVWWKVLLAGSSVGFLTGFLGVGGGFLIVPALVLVLKMDMREAVGSSLVVIAMNSLAGLLGHLGDGGLNWTLISLLLSGGALGVFLGARAAHYVPVARLRQAFAGLVIVLGVTLLIVNLPLAVMFVFAG